MKTNELGYEMVESEDVVERRNKLLRPALLLLGIGVLFLIGRATGLTQWLTISRLQQLLIGAGMCGVACYVAAFSIGTLFFLPGMLFAVAAVLTWGVLAGGAIALVSSTIAVTLGFVVYRAVGGKALANIERPLVRKIMSHLSDRPVRTVALLRLVFFTSPPLNSALALSPIRFRDYLVGSTLGLVLPSITVAIFVERVSVWLL